LINRDDENVIMQDPIYPGAPFRRERYLSEVMEYWSTGEKTNLPFLRCLNFPDIRIFPFIIMLTIVRYWLYKYIVVFIKSWRVWQ
ncbi:MAG: hypothetical protein JW896_18995, partial [Deltaproteobacteria bacterium]|nr:hypothetical protein [Deltaproteobacteria bacterium]